MRFSKSQIAALVLGYLRSEKLISVVEEFLKCCPYFGENSQDVRIGKYFLTRVDRMSLINFLEEYATIFSIVQSRLEETNYFETHNKTSLVEELLYLLDRKHPSASTSLTVVSACSEVDATPAHTLPGNSSVENDNVVKTPKKRTSGSRSRDKEEALDMTEVLTQSLLEHHELHEKIAETINIVRNTPEVAKTVSDEHISAGASKELDAVIKTVIQRTEEDPVYNKFLNEIIGTASTESPPVKKTSCNTSLTFNSEDITKARNSDEMIKNQSHSEIDPIDDHNNDAIRSIIEVSQSTDPPQNFHPETSTPAKNESGGEVIFFDGTLDTYLKSSGATTATNPNPVYLNPGGLIVVPPPTKPPKQFFIVNNQPMFSMNMPTMLTEKDLLSIPTIIVNDESAPLTSQALPVSASSVNKKVTKKTKILKPKISESTSEASTRRTETTKGKCVDSISTIGKESIIVTSSQTTPSITVTESQTAKVVTTPSVTTRQASHVRNLDFSTPSCRSKEEATKSKKSGKAWDADLRLLVHGCKDKSPSPKRKRQLSSKRKKTKQSEEDGTNEATDEMIEEEEKGTPHTPIKDSIPKTPGGMTGPTGSVHCTPFNDVLEEQLKGVDLNSLPTPSIPITPGFALTPGEIIPFNQRSTDYSTSSSYYQPSDTEQGKTISQLIEECRELETALPTQDNFSSLKILSDVVIEQAKVTVAETKTEERKNLNDHLKKFNNNVIGKKNLSLIKRVPTTSSSSDSESLEESEKGGGNKTVAAKCETDTKANNVSSIKNIINTVKVKSTLDDEAKRNLLNTLEEKRLRTVNKIKNSAACGKRPVRNSRKPPPKHKASKSTKKRTKKKGATEENTDEEAQNLVKGLAQRGIHLIPNKLPQNVDQVEEIDETSCVLEFDRKTYEDCEVVVYDDKSEKKPHKTYDLSVLKKSISAAVFLEDLNEEVVRIIRWTEGECVLNLEKVSSAKKNRKGEQEFDDELMDYALIGSAKASPEIKPGCKGGKKRKSRFSEDDKQVEKKNKKYEELLKKINVDDFLDKVHGE